jgi:excinuclease ABC subunit B
MAEKLSEFLIEAGIRTTYIHSDVDTIERIEIMKNLRLGNIDVLIGVNLLREGLDLPEVSLVAILDADKEGFLRSKKSLIQTIGRAARHIEGKSILYADNITDSMKSTIDDNKRKRTIQIKYNKEHNLKPKSLVKNIKTEGNFNNKNKVKELDEVKQDIDELSVDELKKIIVKTKNKMNEAAISMEFIEAAKYRDMLKVMEAKLSKL